MGEFRRQARFFFVFGVALMVAGLVFALVGMGVGGIVVGIIGFLMLVLGWYGEQHAPAPPPRPPTR